MNSENIKIIFFDLDNTLFDHRRAEQSALRILLHNLQEIFASVNEEEFIRLYDKNNGIVWKKLAEGEISSQELKILRFQMTFDDLMITTANAEEISERYLKIYTNQTFASPNVYETLKYLKPNYELGILSNGFSNIQESKLTNLRLNSFFKYKIYSGDAGAMKPSFKIFYQAMNIAKAQANEIAYVGDSYEDDIKGAKAVGWKAILYNPLRESTNGGLADAEITDFLELKKIF
ncbi:MAG: YjjG family noncanonical pyrimidine nucleotidase [bacterium]